MAGDSREGCVKIVFLGNHTVGVSTLSVLADRLDVVGVVAHPADPEDGVCYQSVFEYAKSRSLPVIRGKASELGVANFIKKADPDMIWITDYRYLLPVHILNIVPLGTINLHPSLLPKYRGRAPINWAILEGETNLGLTAHYVNEGMDSGDIIEQQRFEISTNEDVGDALRKLLPLYTTITHRILDNLQTGCVARRKQNDAEATYYPARKPEDGQIDWNHSATAILNLVRAVAAPYPGAFTFLGDSKVLIWKSYLAQPCLSGCPGLVVGFEDGAPVVACGEGALVLSEIEFSDAENCQIALGVRFTVKEHR